MSTERIPDLTGTKISFDGDGVTIGSPEWMVRFLNKCAKTSYKVSDISVWGAIKNWAKDAGLDEDTAEKIEQRWYKPWAIFQAQVVPGSWFLLRNLGRAGADVHIVTSREPGLAEVTYAWYGQKMPWIPRENIHIRNENDPRDGTIFKAETVAEISAAVHHEDNPKDISAVLDNSSAYVIALPLGKISLDGVGNRERVFEIRGSDMEAVYKLYCNSEFIEKIKDMSHNLDCRESLG